MAGTVPFTLHQKVKFVVEEQSINVAAKEDIVATLTTSNSYIKVDENVCKTLELMKLYMVSKIKV